MALPSTQQTDSRRASLGGVRDGLERHGRSLLLIPVVLFFGLLLLGPLVGIAAGALEGGAGSWSTLESNPTVGLVVQSTVVVSIVTTVITTVLGYLVATLAWRSSGLKRLLVFGFVLLPFWTGVLVKTFAWTVLLGDHGVINNALLATGIISAPLDLLHNQLAVIIGMVHYCLPYAVLPIFASMLSINFRLEQAAESLGAGGWNRLRFVLFPLARPGILASAMLVFIISVGFFITPVILGGPRDRMVANLIDYYQAQISDFNTASLLAIIVTLAVSVLVVIYQRLPKEGQYGND